MINSRLQKLEQTFILDYGIYDKKPFHRHTIFSPGDNDYSDFSAFNLILDPISRYLEADLDKDKAYWLLAIKKSFTKLQYTIESATHLLQLNGF